MKRKRGSCEAYSESSNSSKKNPKKPFELTRLEAFESPVIKYLIENLHGFPFNTKSSFFGKTVKKDGNITFKKMNSRYVTYDDVKELLTDHDVLIIKSPMGSGKTTLFKRIISDHDNYLIVSSRKSYSEFMCGELPELVNYKDVKGSISADEHPNSIIQVQSLRRIKEIKKETTYAQWDFVYADEPNGIFNEVISTVSTPEERIRNSGYLRRIVSNIPFVLATDAGLAPWHVNVIQKHLLSNLNRRKIACVINEYKPRSHTIRVFDSCLLRPTKYINSFLPSLKKVLGEEIGIFMEIEQFFSGKQGSAAEDVYTSYVKKTYAAEGLYDTSTDIIQYLSYVLKCLGENAVVVCNTKKMALMVANYVRKLMGYGSYLLLTGDTDPESKKMFMTEPLSRLKGKCCLIHTTMVNVGFDMNFEWCKQVFVLVDSMNSKHTPPITDLFQGVGRNRKAGTVNVYVTGRRVMPTKYALQSKGFVSDHITFLLKETNSYNTVRDDPFEDDSGERLDVEWENEIAYENVFHNPEYRLLKHVVTEKDSLEAVIHTMHKAEKCLNNSPRTFSDAFLYLLKCTLQKGEVEYRGSSWSDEHIFFHKQEDIEHAIGKCQTVFHHRIAKYTTLTLDSFKSVLKQYHNKSEKLDVLKATAETLKIFKGTFETSYGILRRLNPELLKQWAVSYRKFQFEEPTHAVDMLNFEEETIACCMDGKDLIEKVKKNLFRMNRESGLKTFDDFKQAVEYTNQLLDGFRDCQDESVVIEGLTRYLVDDYEISTDMKKAYKKICKATGLVRDQNRFFLPTNKTYSVDIHKMCALLLI